MHQLHIALVFQRNIVAEQFCNAAHHDTISLGTDKQCTLRVEHEAFGQNYTLLKKSSDNWELHAPAQIEMSAQLGPQTIENKSTECKKYPFKPNDWAILSLGNDLDVVVCFEEPPIPVASSALSRLSDSLRSGLTLTLLLSLLFHACIIFYAFWSVRTQKTTTWEALEPRWVELLTTIEEHKELEVEPPPPVEEVDDIITDDTNPLKHRDKDNDTKNDIAELGKIDKPVGIQAALGMSKIAGSGMDSLFGSAAGLGDASDQMAITPDGDAFGTGMGFGAGLAGMRGGGGGGSIGGGGIGALGGGSAQKNSQISGPSKQKTKIKPKMELSTAEASQFCKESNIREVVAKRANALRNCYEQQLLASPQLSGKIVLMWKIGLEGEVTSCSVKSTTMNNNKVEACLEKTVKRLRFDKPDGGICVVEFPFIFTTMD